MRMRHRTFGSGALVVAVAVALGGQPPATEPAPPAAPQPAEKPAGQPPEQTKPPTLVPLEMQKPEQRPEQPPAEAAPPTEPREAIVLLRDGQRYTGLLVSRDDEKVVLKIAGIDTAIPTTQIDRLTVLAPVMERYRSMRAAIDDSDVESLMKLAEWLRTRGQWDAALTELGHILKVQPDSYDAKKMRTLVLSQKKLAEAAGNPRGPRAGSVGPAGPVTGEGAPDFPLLPERDINIIKVYEVDLNDPPRMMVDRRTVERLIKEHAGDPAMPATADAREALLRSPPSKVLELMFKVQARNLYGEVQVLDHPRSMRLFRDEVQRSWLVNNCATARCHGGPDAGRLRLTNKRQGTDAAVYTNFLILDRFRMADGRPLINYEEPSKSPLLELALPRDPGRVSHPVVPASEGHGDLWRPFFHSQSDRRFEEAVGWIKAMYRPRPEYPVVYSPPTPSQPKAPAPPVTR